MDFKALETFVWIARLGSFRAAAQHLYTSQPAISARIANLEQQLGVKLFERANRHVTPTAKGRDLLEYAERLLTLRGDMINAVADPAAIQGIIRLGVVETIAHTWLPQLIERLNRAYPAIILELDVDTSVTLEHKLIEREVDIAFLMGPVSRPDVINHPLSNYRLVWVANPRLPLPKEPVTLAQLAKWPIITYPRFSKPHVAIQRLVTHANTQVRIHSSSSLATIIRLTADGLGLSALPPEIIRSELERGELRIFEVEGELLQLNFTVSHVASPESPVIHVVRTLALSVAKANKNF